MEQNQNTILYSIILSLENRALYEIMWTSIVEPDRPQMTIRRMRITCWIAKATHTHSEWVNNYCFSTASRVTRTRLNVTLYVYWLSCLCFIERHGQLLRLCDSNGE